MERPLTETEQRDALRQLLSNAVGAHKVTPPHLRISTPPDLLIPLLEHQKLGVEWMLKMEKSTNRGGILADDMGNVFYFFCEIGWLMGNLGLGKTIQSIATMLVNPPEDRSARATLIVAPTSLVLQVSLLS
jgi:SNF2 family DNA or RNA helicase